MATNADEPETTEEQSEELSQDDEQLRQDLKEALAKDAKSETKETETDTKSEPEAKEEAQAEPEATLTKEVPLEPERDLDWYKKAYSESTAEGLRQKKRADDLEATKVEAPVPEVLRPEDSENLTPEQLYIRQKQDEEIKEAFDDISAKYPQVKDPETYKKFVAEANILGQVIVQSQKRFPSPKELYSKTVVLLGLQTDNSEEIGAAVKAGAETTRTSSVPSLPQKSKVTEEMIDMNLKMYPLKSRAQIIEELEPHVT